jgi:TM2 domain-containing membrane protein YozV
MSFRTIELCREFFRLSSSLAGFLDQTGNGWGQLRADALPVGQAILGDAEALFLAGCDRVVETDALDEATVATVAGIGCNDVEEGTPFSAATSQTNNDHDYVSKKCSNTEKPSIIARYLPDRNNDVNIEPANSSGSIPLAVFSTKQAFERVSARFRTLLHVKQRIMAVTHKNKTLATLLAAAGGGIGLHRFYLAGPKDAWGWLHLATVPLSLLLAVTGGDRPLLFSAMPIVLSALAAVVEALVIGLTPDDKWDARHNPASGRQSSSNWPLALLLVLTTGVGAMAVIAVIARTFDLLYTGGAYG